MSDGNRGPVVVLLRIFRYQIPGVLMHVKKCTVAARTAHRALGCHRPRVVKSVFSAGRLTPVQCRPANPAPLPGPRKSGIKVPRARCAGQVSRMEARS